MMNMTIGRLAKKMKVPVSTLRFYERLRLLTPERRNHSNYRRYNSKSTEKLGFILEARQCGLTLSDISRLFKASGPVVRRIFSNRMDSLRAEAKELALQQQRLAGLMRRYDRLGQKALPPSRNHRTPGKGG